MNNKLFISNKCIPSNYKVSFALNVFTHITFLFIILTMVFVFYTENIMSTSINKEIYTLIEDNLDNILDKTVTNENSDTTQTILKYLPFDKIKAIVEDNTYRSTNNKLITRTLFIIAVLLIFSLIFGIIIAKMECGKIDIKDILIENFIIFFFVGIIEIVFLKFIILKYIPGYPSTIKNILYDILKKY